MLFRNLAELEQYTRRAQTETLYYAYSANDEGDLLSTVSDDEGTVLFTTTYSPNSDYMLVTDNRTGEVKREPISLSHTLEEITEDMRELGYLSENQTLELAE